MRELLKDEQTTIRCFVRNETKAREVLPVDNPRVRFGPVDLEDPENVEQRTLDGDADAVVWCATGLASDGSTLIDQISLPTLAKALPKVSRDAPPNCVMLSSAAVTRPGWSSRKQKKFERSYDIPIVRLNPAGILGKKLNAEKKLARATPAFCVVRPVGLNDDWPRGRPVFSQGDVAVGRSNREDVAAVLVAALDATEARGKTFEMATLKGYAPPSSFDDAFGALAYSPSRRARPRPLVVRPSCPASSRTRLDWRWAALHEEVDSGAVDREGAAATDREGFAAAAAAEAAETDCPAVCRSAAMGPVWAAVRAAGREDHRRLLHARDVIAFDTPSGDGPSPGGAVETCRTARRPTPGPIVWIRGMRSGRIAPARTASCRCGCASRSVARGARGPFRRPVPSIAGSAIMARAVRSRHPVSPRLFVPARHGTRGGPPAHRRRRSREQHRRPLRA